MKTFFNKDKLIIISFFTSFIVLYFINKDFNYLDNKENFLKILFFYTVSLISSILYIFTSNNTNNNNIKSNFLFFLYLIFLGIAFIYINIPYIARDERYYAFILFLMPISLFSLMIQTLVWLYSFFKKI